MSSSWRAMVIAAAAVVLGVTVSLPAMASPGVFGGTNGIIAFTRANQIYTITSSGTHLTKLTISGKNYNPEWNPAGTEIAFIHEYPAGVRNVWVMSKSGSNKREWTNTGTAWGGPAWSPDGKQLAVTIGGKFGLLQTTSGTTPLQPRATLYGNFDPGGTPEYSPIYGYDPSWTSAKIAYTGPDCTGNEDVCLWVYDTANQDTYGVVGAGFYCHDENSNVDMAKWAPDGSNLIYQYEAGGNGCGGPPANGPYITTLYNDAIVTQAGDQQPDYSPDGAHIIFTHATAGQLPQIVIATTTGGNRHTLTQGYQPDWQSIPVV
jgi:Tol biopolymer transport system component